MKTCATCKHAEALPMKLLLICQRVKTWHDAPLDDVVIMAGERSTKLYTSPWFGCTLHEERKDSETKASSQE